jgi:hypothetical protein
MLEQTISIEWDESLKQSWCLYASFYTQVKNLTNSLPSFPSPPLLTFFGNAPLGSLAAPMNTSIDRAKFDDPEGSMRMSKKNGSLLKEIK